MCVCVLGIKSLTLGCLTFLSLGAIHPQCFKVTNPGQRVKWYLLLTSPLICQHLL